MDGDKIVISNYIIMHLTATDFIVGFVGAFIRILGNYSKARHKVQACGEVFTNARYWNEHWDKIVYGLVAGLGLLFIVPECMIDVSDLIFGRKVTWNSGFSGIIGLAGVEVVAAIIQRTKLKSNEPEAVT